MPFFTFSSVAEHEIPISTIAIIKHSAEGKGKPSLIIVFLLFSRCFLCTACVIVNECFCRSVAAKVLETNANPLGIKCQGVSSTSTYLNNTRLISKEISPKNVAGFTYAGIAYSHNVMKNQQKVLLFFLYKGNWIYYVFPESVEYFFIQIKEFKTQVTPSSPNTESWMPFAPRPAPFAGLKPSSKTLQRDVKYTIPIKGLGITPQKDYCTFFFFVKMVGQVIYRHLIQHVS